MRARGLKLLFARLHKPPPDVAPHAGAWIETILKGLIMAKEKVAPHAGAWIETTCRWPGRMKCSRRAPCGRVD